MKNYRPAYHYRASENWINDPCGMIQHQGVYHLYHQYNPHGDHWGDMHWGHAVSEDLVHWREQEIAMKPDAAHGGSIASPAADIICPTGGRHSSTPALITGAIPSSGWPCRKMIRCAILSSHGKTP